MGRPRKPDHLKILEGSREDRINRDAPTPDVAELAPPIPLDEEALAWWRKLAPDMLAKGVLTEWDTPAFAMACDMLARYWELGDLLVSQQNPEMPKYTERGAAGGVIKSPYFQMQKDAWAMLAQVFSRFGMTPADRAKLSVKGDDGPTGLDELIS